LGGELIFLEEKEKMTEALTQQQQRVMYYDHVKQKLEGSMIDKAIKFFNADCIKPVFDEQGNKTGYECLPLKGYNTRTYSLKRHPVFNWQCNCQGWNKKASQYARNEIGFVICSHVIALSIYLKDKRKKEE